MLVGRYKRRCVKASSNAVSEFVCVSKDVFGVLESNGVKGKVDRGFVVEVQGGRGGDGVAKVLMYTIHTG